MREKSFRVRFAPAPTGMMHLGNIRTALMNYLIARKKNGTFVIRIEDTDPERNFDPKAEKIIEDLLWLGLTYDEGPAQGGPHKPYFQSQRTSLYQQKLHELIQKKLVYRCFCTAEELEKKRNRQRALKQPPRYDRSCLPLTTEHSDERAQKEPFIWRMKVPHEKVLTVTDLSHGTINFELKNFSDFPITRQNGTVTFMFANFVDDTAMKISCVIRGEDHLSNTAGQAALYEALGEPLPLFWHLPILCNIDGKKLSKRDFGFSLRDLKNSGFVPEAILNYLAIIGGSFKQEIMSIEELVDALDFEQPSTTGQIKYDVEKLRWINHKWLCKLPTQKVATLSRPYLQEVYEQVASMNDSELTELISHIQQEMVTLQDAVQLLAFYFGQPEYKTNIARTLVPADQLEQAKTILEKESNFTSAEIFLDNLKKALQEAGIKPKYMFCFIRYALMGTSNGPGLKELIGMLGIAISKKRIQMLLKLV